MNRDLLEEAKRRLPLSALMALFGFGDRAKKSARCPFHEDSSASFSVYTGDDGEERFNCFAGCGGGDSIDFLAKQRGLSNPDACREFIQLANVSPMTTTATMPSSKPTPSVQPDFNWQQRVNALTHEHRAKLAAWRGYAPKFVEWAHAEKIIGLFDDDHIAFPMKAAQTDKNHNQRRLLGGAFDAVTNTDTTPNAASDIVGCHYRLKEDGSWRFFPTGTRTAPFIIGDMASARKVFAFESQWDLLAVLDCFHHHIQPLADTAFICTRGAENGKLIAGLCVTGADVYAFAQNDEPHPKTGIRAGQKWLEVLAAHCGCKCFQVVTPAPHKDANDWTRAAATRQEIEAAITAAQPVTVSTAPDLSAASSKNVSTPVITVPEEPDEPEASPFPLDALPPVMASIIAAVSRTERVPITLPAMCALSVVSAAIGAGLEVSSGPNRVTRGNLPFLGSAESGVGKSETFRIIAAPILDHQTRLIETWKQKTLVNVQSETGVLKREITTLERKAAKATETLERARLLGEIEFRKARENELARRAAMPCIIAQDVTTERLAVLLRDNREVIFSASADARKLVDNLMGRYNPGKTTDESLYLTAYSGDFVRVDRQGRDAVVLNKPCLALCWFVQPDLLETMLDEQSLSASGFLPRLLICHTNATPRRIEGEPQVLSETVRSQWLKLIDDLLATFHAADKPQRITPTPEAMTVLNDFHNRIVDRRSTDLADVGAFAARYAENAWRLAVVLHAAFYGAEAHAHTLDKETASNAIRVAEWFAVAQLDILAKGRRAAAVKVEDEVLELLDDNIQRKGRNSITARDVDRARITATPEAARALLARMEASGVLVGSDSTPLHGGKTTRNFQRTTNPVPE